MKYNPSKKKRFQLLPQGLFRWVGFIVIVLTSYGYVLSSYLPDMPPQPVAEKTKLPEINIPIAIPEDALAVLDDRASVTVNVDKSREYYSIITKAADRYAVDPNLIKAIIMVESSYDPKAVSHVGAMGLMQLMPKTAEEMGVEDCFNPEHNIYGGVRYFKWLLTTFDGNIELSLAAYNAGRRNVLRYNGIPPYKDTQQYIKKVDEYYSQFYKLQLAEELNRV